MMRGSTIRKSALAIAMGLTTATSGFAVAQQTEDTTDPSTVRSTDTDSRETTQESLNRAIHSAIRNGDFAALKDAIEQGAEINGHRYGGRQPIVYAASLDRTKMVQRLVDLGADLEVQSDNYLTALMQAARRASVDTVEVLIDGGSDVRFDMAEEKGEDGIQRAIHFAARYNSLDVMKALVDAGADPTIPNYRDITPLMFAALNNGPQVVAYLLDNGADPALTDDEGRRAIDMAKLVDNRDVLDHPVADRLRVDA